MDIKACLWCKKEVAQTKGKRERKFCSNECRQKHWQDSQKALRKHIKEFGLQQFQNTPAAVEIDPKKAEIDALNKQISAIEAEPQPTWVKSFDGFQGWKRTQQKRIEAINQKLSLLL